MSYYAALCDRCAAKTDSREFCTGGHMRKRECEWCGGDFKGSCTRLEGERPKPVVCDPPEKPAALSHQEELDRDFVRPYVTGPHFGFPREGRK